MTNLQAEADKAANRYGINPGIYRALVGQESRWKTNARSPVGATGLTQLMPDTARSVGVTNPLDPVQSLNGGAKYLKQQLNRFGGDYRKALAAYNAGPGAVQKYGGVPPYAETQNYVKTIMGNAGSAATSPSRSPSSGTGTGTSTVTTTTTPSVDNSGLRKQLVANYLSQGGVKNSGATAAFATSYRGAQDVPGTTSTSTSRSRSTTKLDPSTATVSGVQAITDRADKLNADKRPYVYGGGHTGDSWGIDCSAAVSQALGVDVRVSGEFEKFGKPGKGKSVTIYANGGHVLMEVNGHFFGTSQTNPQGGPGWIPRDAIPASYLKNFTARHPSGM